MIKLSQVNALSQDNTAIVQRREQAYATQRREGRLGSNMQI